MRFVLFICSILFAACAGSQKTTSGKCKDCKGTVIVFLGIDCPISQKYMVKLNSLAEKYGETVSWVGKVPEKVTEEELKVFGRDYNLKFPLTADKDQKEARGLKATVTPEVFVFDKGGLLKYQGAIDNWFYELGKNRLQITEHYLDSALSAVVRGYDPALSKTEAIGCFIQHR